jgi:NitT/TauT family transport system substrate-binding protein
MLGVALALGAAQAPARADVDPATLALPAEGMNFLAYYIAEDLGIFKAQGIDVKSVVIAGVGSFNAVVAGSVDFSFSSGSSLTRAAAHGQRMLALAQENNLPVWDIVLQKDIADAAQFDPRAPLAVRAALLKGRTMGIAGVQALDNAYLNIVAKEGGADLASMKLAPMGSTELVAAFERKAIDGFVSGPPWPQVVEDDGTAVPIAIGPNGEPASLVPIASSLLIARPQTCIERRVLCEKIGRSMVLASQAVHERTKDVLAALEKRFQNIKPAVLERSLAALVKVMPMVPLVDAVALKKADEINVDAGFMKPDQLLSSYEGLATNEYLK